jgi:AraC-like DNA-binding protein
MIIVDDMNDWVGCLGGHPQVKTPHIDRLAKRGLLFTNAHVAAPVCNPSRVATLTGLRPSTTGIYGNETKWLEALPAQVDTSELPTLERRKKLVDRACELMMGHADEPLSILEVCSRVGTSRRKLNYCFQDVLGTTPIKYLRSLRLNSVRRALRQAAPGVTIQDIASHWGFWHLSQFAQDYRQLFGELPSDTLHKR